MHVLPKKYLTDRVQLSENPWWEKKSWDTYNVPTILWFYVTKDPGINLAIPSLEGKLFAKCLSMDLSRGLLSRRKQGPCHSLLHSSVPQLTLKKINIMTFIEFIEVECINFQFKNFYTLASKDLTMWWLLILQKAKLSSCLVQWNYGSTSSLNKTLAVTIIHTEHFRNKSLKS